jgi:hypothetical protein
VIKRRIDVRLDDRCSSSDCFHGIRHIPRHFKEALNLTLICL